MVGDEVVALTAGGKGGPLEGEYVRWRPRYEVEAKAALKIFKILLPGGLSSSVPYDETLTLRKVLQNVLRKKPELDVAALGEPRDLHGRTLAQSKTLGELGTLEILWGTNKLEWSLAANHYAVNQFLAEEVRASASPASLLLIVPPRVRKMCKRRR